MNINLKSSGKLKPKKIKSSTVLELYTMIKLNLYQEFKVGLTFENQLVTYATRTKK
jgi:hypothetical protein